MTTSTNTRSTDPIALLSELTAEQIRNRLQTLEAERRALHVLLRSAAARERAAARRVASRPDKNGGPHHVA